MKLKTLACLSLITLVASLGPAAHAQTYNIIWNFLCDCGTGPAAGVTIKAGNIYGTARDGATNNGGSVYLLTKVGNNWSGSDLFALPDNAGHPQARIIFSLDGHPYGTSSGSGNNDLGTVFNVFPNPTICKVVACQPWRENVLHIFKGFPFDGAHPGYGDLVWDPQGNIYGTTTIGGTNEFGVVYELTPPVPPSKTWTESVIWNFTGPDGENPQNAVIFDRDGNLLGTAKQGGASEFGTVFKLTPSGNAWTETNVYDFQGGSDGQYPIAGLLIDSSGNIYGATSDGGSGGGGTVFELIPSGNTYTFKLLYGLSGQQGQNCGPWGTLSMDAVGNLYGTTYCDGVYSLGGVFKVTNTQNGWTYTSLHDFPAFRSDGKHPISNVTFDPNGNLYGTASQDNVFNHGVVWMITP